MINVVPYGKINGLFFLGGPPPPGGYPGGWGVNQWNGEMDPYSDSYMNDYHGHMSLHPFGKPGPKSVRPIMK